MIRQEIMFAVVLVLCGAIRARGDQYAREIRPLLQQFCYECHGEGGDEGNLRLDHPADLSLNLGDRDKWLAVWRNLRAATMPPPAAEQPTAAQRQQVARWIQREIFQLDSNNPDPGRVTVRRLNRQEYVNTISDLFEVQVDADETFPADDTGYGFDTVGDALTLSPWLLEKYLETAEQIVAEVIAAPELPITEQYLKVFLDGRPPEEAAERQKYATKILRHVADRALRRPVSQDYLNRLLKLADVNAEGAVFEAGIARGLTAILSSPRFLYRAELQPQPNDPDKIVPLDDFALASRLSYFLWTSAPDEELFQLAREQKLRKNLREQVDRMMDDGKFARFIDNFVGQWLQTRDVQAVPVEIVAILGTEKAHNSPFNGRVRRAMQQETNRFVEHIFRQDRVLTELLTADYTFLDSSLAAFYGIEGIEGGEPQMVQLPPGSHRGGLLTHGGILLVTSNPTRTSAVKRGLFVLENLLGTPAPPAPPDVPELAAARAALGADATMRDHMQLHRQQPLCASCHARMDPLGLALENYNAIGLWRDEENGTPIDASGELMTGESFEDFAELQEILARDRQPDFFRCVTEKMMTYALGRGLEYYDMPTVDRIVERLQTEGVGSRELIYAIVESAAFQKRRGDGEATP